MESFGIPMITYYIQIVKNMTHFLQIVHYFSLARRLQGGNLGTVSVTCEGNPGRGDIAATGRAGSLFEVVVSVSAVIILCVTEEIHDVRATHGTVSESAVAVKPI